MEKSRSLTKKSTGGFALTGTYSRILEANLGKIMSVNCKFVSGSTLTI